MDILLKDRFMTLWKQFFNEAPLPVTFSYTDNPVKAEAVELGKAPRCIMGSLVLAQKGQSLAFSAETVGCPGGKRYLGFSEGLMPNFEYFLSCGIPGEMEGERYKKTPEMVKEYMKNSVPVMKAPAKYIVFKRWDRLEKTDQPEVVIFFCTPDVLSGLYTLAIFDETTEDAVITPFGSGCASIVQHPYLETTSDHPRAVIGMFDVSARPFVTKDVLSFAAPMNKFTRMIENMEESFLITGSWRKVQKRIK
jgi:uncharacterized protein (DUF169 family)